MQFANMMNLKSISKPIQTQFNLPSKSFTPSPYSSRHLSFKFHKSPLISIRKTTNLPPNATTSNGVYNVYTPLPEETLYDLLGVPQSGTHSEIKRGYKNMALKYHPDVAPPDRVNEYTLRFIQVKEAYETLSEPEARAIYDCNLAMGLHLNFSGKKGSRFEARSDEMARWKQSWEVQVEALRRRSAVETGRVGEGGAMSWAARIRTQRARRT